MREFLDGRVFLEVEIFFFFSSRRRHTRCSRDWSSDVCSSDLNELSAEEKASLVRWKEELAALRAELSRPVPVAHGLQEGGVPESAHAGIHDVQEIGRASCRERV